MVDAHCHLQEIEENEWKNNGLTAMICNSTGVRDSQRAVELAGKYNQVYATVGLGYSVDGRLDNQVNALEKLFPNQKLVGVGEIGLDFWAGMKEETREEQMHLFSRQIDLGKKFNLPVIVHNRNAAEDILGTLDYNRAVMHCFTGDMNFMRACVDRGWFISFGGILTFKRSSELREVAKEVPEKYLLVETDAPYIAPEPVRGTPNVPGNVKYVLDCLGEVRGEKADKIERITTENAVRFFGLQV